MAVVLFGVPNDNNLNRVFIIKDVFGFIVYLKNNDM